MKKLLEFHVRRKLGSFSEMVDDFFDTLNILVIFLLLFLPEDKKAPFLRSEAYLDESNKRELAVKIMRREFDEYHNEYYTDWHTSTVTST